VVVRELLVFCSDIILIGNVGGPGSCNSIWREQKEQLRQNTGTFCNAVRCSDFQKN
jgi:hypothetical protein